MNVRAWLAVLGLSLTCTLSGCWDLHELNEVSLVSGMAVDKGKEHSFRLSLEVINSAEIGGKRSTGVAPVTVYSEEGDALMELTRKMNTGLSRKLIYSHMRVMAIADSIVREGQMEFLDYIERDREIRDDFNMLVVRGARAEDVISSTSPIQKVPSLKINRQIQSMVEEWGGDPLVRMKDFIAALTSPGRQPVLAIVTIQGDPEKGKDVANNNRLKPDGLVVLDGMAVFKDFTMIGSLSLEDTRNFVWAQGKLINTAITVPCESTNQKYFGVLVHQSSTDVSARYEKGVPHITINVSVEGYINATQCALDLEQLDTYQKLEMKMKQSVEERLKRTIDKVQKKYGVDIFGFGEDMYRQDTKAFKKVRDKWDEEFRKAKIDVNAEVRLRRSGIRTKSLFKELK